MPLDLPGLQDALEQLCAAPPPDVAGCAQEWAAAMASYASGIIPASATVAAAASALAGGLATAFAAPVAAPGMESAFAAFAVTVGGGMAGFAPTPPPAPVGFAVQFAGPKPPTHAAAAQQIAGLIDVWMKTGTGTMVAPPFTIVPWS